MSEYIAKFITNLKMESTEHSDNGKWRIFSPLIYSSKVAKRLIVVPTGFITDLASVPRLPFIYLVTGGKANEASVIHDYLYVSKMVSRSMADAVFREAMAASGVSGWRRWMMWSGVRVGGGSAWDSHALPIDNITD